MSELTELKRMIKDLQVRVSDLEKGVGRPPMETTRCRDWIGETFTMYNDYSAESIFIAAAAQGFSKFVTRKSLKQLGWYYEKLRWYRQLPSKVKIDPETTTEWLKKYMKYERLEDVVIQRLQDRDTRITPLAARAMAKKLGIKRTKHDGEMYWSALT